MVIFPNAKINLGLNIIEKRPDGYHNLETIFYPIALEDALEVNIRQDLTGRYELCQNGWKVTEDAEKNLVVKAFKLLDAEFNLPPTSIVLHKRIPAGAGLGGGSADAACMLKLLNSKYDLGLTDDILEKYAARLGADCAFFIKNKPAFAEGIGDILSPVPLSLQGYKLLLVKPDIFVSTQDAFSKIKPHRPEKSLKEIIQLPVELWKDTMVNDFEESVFSQFPAIGEIKQRMYSSGAVYASMSGSGSSVYGLFKAETELPEVDFGEKALVYKISNL